jgi:alpha-L-arabinofuranosidase
MQNWQRVFAAALRSPQGHLTLAVVNDAPQEFGLALSLEGLAEARRFHRYGITPSDRDRADVQVAPQREFALSTGHAALSDRLAPRSVTVYSTHHLAPSAPGIMAE